jgi:hypothetical protein
VASNISLNRGVIGEYRHSDDIGWMERDCKGWRGA